MEFKQEIVPINLNKVKYLFIEKLINILIENGVLIFGGAVRDKMVHDHYCRKFHEAEMDTSKFSDPSYHPETKHRLLVANDIDAFVRGNKDDVQKLFDTLDSRGYKVIVKAVKQKYFTFTNLDHQKVEISIKGADGLGLQVKIPVDILFSEEKDIEPPFGRLDLLCNGFVMDKFGIRLSTQTGTRMDLQKPFTRKMEELEILEKIFKLRTDIAEMWEEDNDSHNRDHRISRIIGMQGRGWEVNNRVFCSEKKEHKDEICVRCARGPNKLQRLVKLKCCDRYIHHWCLYHQMTDSELAPRCPKCDTTLQF